MPSILQFKVLIKKNHLNIRCARLKISNDKEYSKEFISCGALLVIFTGILFGIELLGNLNGLTSKTSSMIYMKILFQENNIISFQ